MIALRDCLGRERSPSTVYPDGSYNCPFCVAAVQVGSPEHTAGTCPSPGCWARAGYPVERARAEQAEQERLGAESAQRIAAGQAREQARIVEVKCRAERVEEIRAACAASGACLVCALKSTRYGRNLKLTKHRKACPQGRL